MNMFVVDGLSGKASLSGEVSIEGAKNAALPIMAAALVVSGETVLTNVPDIADVASMSTLLEGVGAYVTCKDGQCSIRTQDVNRSVLDPTIAKLLRASVLLTGSVLARVGKVVFPHPGGCVLGSRPIDIFLEGFEKLGCTISERHDAYTITAENGIEGGEIFFKTISVTATETFMIASTKAKAPVVLKNCAMEPEIVATAEYLEACGARIEGAGTSTITIHPSHLEAPPDLVRIIPDRIEAGSFLLLGALLGKKITLRNCEPKHLEAVTETLRSMGVTITTTFNTMSVSAPSTLTGVSIRTHEYPGFPTDLQAPFAVLLTQAKGESSILETVFDGRLNYLQDLSSMGAHAQVWNPHKATIKGPTPLKARDIDGPDIRAGLAFLLAAAVAEGKSKVGNAHLIDRGYERIEDKLASLGLPIQRITHTHD